MMTLLVKLFTAMLKQKFHLFHGRNMAECKRHFNRYVIERPHKSAPGARMPGKFLPLLFLGIYINFISTLRGEEIRGWFPFRFEQFY